MNIKSILMKLYFSLYEKRYKGRVKYLFQRKHSKTLAVIFSGFSETPVYNYVKTLRNLKADKLFILDDFAYRGSYYWYSNGSNEPAVLTQSLVCQYIKRGGYDKVITLGSSKGGTCAIYYGLKVEADDIYAAACQYHVGQYVNTEEHQKVFKSMMGENAGEKEQELLDSVMPTLLKDKADSKALIHLLYSTEEHTYPEHIADMINDLDGNRIKHVDTIRQFKEHGEVGKYFVPWIKKELNIQ